MSEFKLLKERLSLFAAERDWDQFHTPKNILMALTGEVGELCEQLQWLTDQQVSEISGEKIVDIADEIADVQIYLIRLADKLNVDILKSVEEKMVKNAAKYPVDKVKGSALKYDQYTD